MSCDIQRIYRYCNKGKISFMHQMSSFYLSSLIKVDDSSNCCCVEMNPVLFGGDVRARASKCRGRASFLPVGGNREISFALRQHFCAVNQPWGPVTTNTIIYLKVSDVCCIKRIYKSQILTFIFNENGKFLDDCG